MDEPEQIRLEELEEQIARARRRITDQKRLIEGLVANRGDVKGAWDQLISYEEALDHYVQQRRMLLQEVLAKFQLSLLPPPTGNGGVAKR
jgi:hypothetical protein